MIAQLGAAFLMGFLAGTAACWKRLWCLRAKVQVFEYYFGERMKQRLRNSEHTRSREETEAADRRRPGGESDGCPAPRRLSLVAPQRVSSVLALQYTKRKERTKDPHSDTPVLLVQ